MVQFNPKNLKRRFIYITGCDGTGKSTQARLILNQIRACGIKAYPLWLRYPFFFSSPVLLYARLKGYSWYEMNGEYKLGYWDFSKSWFLKIVFPWLLLLDAFMAAVRKVYIPLLLGRSIVCERFVLDMLVDLSVAMKDKELWFKIPGRLFLKLLPIQTILFILDLDAELIRKRRKDLVFDHQLENRLEMFRCLSTFIGIKQISSSFSIAEINRMIQKECHLPAE